MGMDARYPGHWVELAAIDPAATPKPVVTGGTVLSSKPAHAPGGHLLSEPSATPHSRRIGHAVRATVHLPTARPRRRAVQTRRRTNAATTHPPRCGER